ncbi:MAG: pyridoxal phosphate-dependent aminotransferase [Rhizomicrobium sp.]
MNLVAGKGAGAWAVHNEALEARAAGRDITFLTVGDPDQPPARRVIDATIRALRDGHTGYPPTLGYPEVRAAVAQRVERRTGQKCSAANVAIVPGTQAALFSTVRCIIGEGDEVILPEPMYATYEAVGRSTGAHIVNVPLTSENRFHVDPETVAQAITPRTRAIWINSPHNPTGAVMTGAEIAAIAELCVRNDLWLLSDEVYEDIAFARAHVSPWSLPGMAQRTIVVASLSKSHALPGFRMGWVVGPTCLMEHLSNVIVAMFYATSGFIQLGALEALKSDLPEVDALRRDYQRRAELVGRILGDAPNCKFVPPEGGMFLLLDIRGLGLGSDEFARGLLHEKDVAVLPCDGLGPSVAGHLRIALTTNDDRLAKAAKQIVDYARELSSARPGS